MPTPRLRELQRLFWRSLADDPAGFAPAPEVATLVEPSTTLEPGERVRVYAKAYLWRLRDVLQEDFPRVAAVVGPDRFDELARDYLRTHPSEHPSVRHLGREMVHFLERRPDVPSFLPDLARLEWTRREVFDAADTGHATADVLRAVSPRDWPHLHFIPIPALRVLSTAWPVHELWSGAGPNAIGPQRLRRPPTRPCRRPPRALARGRDRRPGALRGGER